MPAIAMAFQALIQVVGCEWRWAKSLKQNHYRVKAHIVPPCGFAATGDMTTAMETSHKQSSTPVTNDHTRLTCYLGEAPANPPRLKQGTPGTRRRATAGRYLAALGYNVQSLAVLDHHSKRFSSWCQQHGRCCKARVSSAFGTLSFRNSRHRSQAFPGCRIRREYPAGYNASGGAIGLCQRCLRACVETVEERKGRRWVTSGFGECDRGCAFHSA